MSDLLIIRISNLNCTVTRIWMHKLIF